MARDQEQQDHIERALPPELLLLLEAFKNEMNAKVSNLRLWGCLALLSGSTISGVVAKFVAPSATTTAVHAVTSLLT